MADALLQEAVAAGALAASAGAAAGVTSGAVAGVPAGAAPGAAACARAALSLSQVAKSALERTSTTMGMKPWSRPHSSAHWPRYRPGLSVSTLNQASFTKPGIASFLTPKAGTHQEWMTSAAVISRRTLVPTGTTSG